MSEETVLTPITPEEGGLPPKVAPFGGAAEEKTESVAPVTTEVKPAEAAAEKPASPVVAKKPLTVKMRPVIRKPVIRKPGTISTLKSIKPISDITKAPAPEQPAAPAAEAAPAATPPPVAEPAAPAAEKPAAPAPNMKAITGSIPVQAVMKKTGIIAEGILTPSQAQASKTKTSRISLESAMGVPPPSSTGGSPLKTIKFRRPSALKPVASPMTATPKPVAPVAPVAAEPAAPVNEEIKNLDPVTEPAETAVTPSSETKTVKIQRPSLGIKRPKAKIGIGATTVVKTPSADADGEIKDIDDIPDIPSISNIPTMAPVAAPESSGSKAFTAIAMVAAVATIGVLGFLMFYFYTQGTGPIAGPNEIPFIQM